MKHFKIIYSLLCLAILGAGCAKEEGIDNDLSYLGTVGSAGLTTVFTITNDNSGVVKMTPGGQGFSTYTVNFGDATGGTASQNLLPGESAVHAYPEGVYTVTVIAFDIAGKGTTKTYPLTVTYRVPLNLSINVGPDVTVSATALYARSFMVYYGDVVNEVGTPLAVGQTLPAHIYPAGGPYDLKVIAFSGGTPTAQATKTMFGFPLSFDVATMNYFFGTFGNVIFSTATNPSATGLNTSAKVGKYEKPNGAEVWSGTYSPLDIPINLAQGKKIKVLVYNPSAGNIGKKLNIELEAAVAGTGATANGVAVLKVPITTSGAWEELVFDFSTIAAIGNNARFNQLVLRFNDIAMGAGEVIYLDNFRLTN